MQRAPHLWTLRSHRVSLHLSTICSPPARPSLSLAHPTHLQLSSLSTDPCPTSHGATTTYKSSRPHAVHSGSRAQRSAPQVEAAPSSTMWGTEIVEEHSRETWEIWCVLRYSSTAQVVLTSGLRDFSATSTPRCTSLCGARSYRKVQCCKSHEDHTTDSHFPSAHILQGRPTVPLKIPRHHFT